MKITKHTAQQGDVILRKLNELPKGDSKSLNRSSRGWVLAEGEITNHAHVVDSADAELIEIGGRMLLKLERAATVMHEEHKPITLEAGIWEVARVQEYDYLAQMTRNVAD